MKGVKKWICAVCLYSLVLALSLVISSLIGIETVNAYEFSLDTIPLWFPVDYYPNFPNYFQFDSGFLVVLDSDSGSTPAINPKAKVPVFNFHENSDDKCVLYPESNQGNYILPYYAYSNRDGFAWNVLGSDLPTYQHFNSDHYCLLPDLNGSDPVWSSSAHVSGSPLNRVYTSWLTTSKPYRFKYDAFRFHDSGKNSSTGFVYNTYFDVFDLFENNTSGTISELHIPLGNGYSNPSISYSNGQPLKFSGSIDIYPTDSSSHISLSSSSSVSIATYFYKSNSNRRISYPCSYSLTDDDSDFSRQVLSYTCDFKLPTASSSGGLNTNDYFIPDEESPWFRLDFDLDYDSASSSSIDSFVFYHPQTLVTDNDYTPAGSFSPEVHSNNPHDVPGGSEYYNQPNNDIDYDDSLSNLFNFNFLNPFAPLFSLFTDNSQCVSIPILAGLLNSEETTYCPWFSADIRNIVTPVVGLSSTMLLFGFLVRWLGARSGNLFEDSLPDEDIAMTKGITTDNYHFANKHRSRK